MAIGIMIDFSTLFCVTFCVLFNENIDVLEWSNRYVIGCITKVKYIYQTLVRSFRLFI